MKKFIAVALSVLIFVMLFAACGKKQAADIAEFIKNLDFEEREYTFNDGELLEGIHYVKMDVEKIGSMIIEIDADAAPISATNFLRLAQCGFYDGLTFHRIISGFMAQGGDGSGSALADKAVKIKGEFAANGYNNPISHIRGVISMARTSDPDSATSQFFIMHEDNIQSLDGQYAAFGRVIAGIEVVDEMCKNADPYAYNGILLEKDRPVINSVTILGAKK